MLWLLVVVLAVRTVTLEGVVVLGGIGLASLVKTLVVVVRLSLP